MAKRLNDTAAITGRSATSNIEHSISTRKIDNGYIVRESSCDPNTGEYKSSERFMKNAPTIVPAKVSRGPSPDGPNSLADAKSYLGDNV